MGSSLAHGRWAFERGLHDLGTGVPVRRARLIARAPKRVRPPTLAKRRLHALAVHPRLALQVPERLAVGLRARRC